MPRTTRTSVVERMAARWDSISNALTGLGGGYDKGGAAKPDLFRSSLTSEEMLSLYRFNGYARRVIDIVPDDCTRRGWNVTGEGLEGWPMQDEDRRLDTWGKLADAHRWGRLYGGSTVLMVVDEGASSPPLSEPLDLSKVRRLLNLVVLDANECCPRTYEGDVTSEGFRSPRLWSVYPYARTTVQALQSGQAIHASRMLYFGGSKLPPSSTWTWSMPDAPILDAIWDQIRNKTSVDQAGAVVAQDFRVNVLKVRGMEAKNASEEASAFQARMRAMARSLSLLNMVLLDESESFETRASSIAGFRELDEQAWQALATVSGMPMQLLRGDAPGGLNTDGESHRRLWASVILAVQNAFYYRQLVKLYTVVFAAKDGPFKGHAPEKWDIEFLDLDTPTDKQTADLRKTVAETDVAYITAGVLDPERVASGRFGSGGFTLDLPPLTDAEIAENEREAAAREKAVAAAEQAIAAEAQRRVAAGLGSPAEPRTGPDAEAPRSDATRTDPYPNEHAARMRDPADFVEGSMRSKDLAGGVRLILGKLEKGGPMVVQAYRFPVSEFTEAEAKVWLKEHDEEPILFEPAKEARGDATSNALATVTAPHTVSFVAVDWNHDAAMERVKAWATGPDGAVDWTRARAAFGWYDSGRSETWEGYHLLHHDVTTAGDLVCNSEGVKDALLEITGALTGTALAPASLRNRVESHLLRHLREAQEQNLEPRET
jgi:phage-related protein (TIGR01555 family)